MALLEDYLYSEEFLLEGEQAEKYLQKKLNDKREKEAREAKREGRRYINSTSYGGGSEWNPAFDKAREIRKHREKYGSVMPKSDTPTEKKLRKAEDKERNAYAYGQKIKNELDERNDHHYEDIAKAADAANRHYRRTHRNESAEVELYEGAIDLI